MLEKLKTFEIISEVVVGLIWSIVISIFFETPALGIALFVAAVVVVLINIKLNHSKNFKIDSIFITFGYLLAFWVFIKTGGIILPALTYVAVVLAIGFIEAKWEDFVDNSSSKLEKKLKDRK